jgi:hypothetical protein
MVEVPGQDDRISAYADRRLPAILAARAAGTRCIPRPATDFAVASPIARQIVNGFADMRMSRTPRFVAPRGRE